MFLCTALFNSCISHAGIIYKSLNCRTSQIFCSSTEIFKIVRWNFVWHHVLIVTPKWINFHKENIFYLIWSEIVCLMKKLNVSLFIVDYRITNTFPYWTSNIYPVLFRDIKEFCNLTGQFCRDWKTWRFSVRYQRCLASR